MDALSRQPNPPRLSLAAGFLFAGVCAGMAGEALVRAVPGPTGVLLNTLGVQGFLFCLAFAGEALLRPLMPAGIALGPSRVRATTLLVLVLGFMVMSHAVSLGLGMLSLRDTGALAEIDRVLRETAAAPGPGLPLALLAIGLAPAVCEELLFRGLVQGSVLRAAGPVAAIAVSSGAFALMHLEWVHGSAAFVLGVYLGLAAFLAGSVRASMLCHAANNTSGVLFPGASLFQGLLPVAVLVPLLGASGALLLAWAWRRESRPQGTPAAGIGSRE